MRCPHCQAQLTTIQRGIVVIAYVAHPLTAKGADLKCCADEPADWQELDDGSHGVYYRCPKCLGDVSDLFTDDGALVEPEATAHAGTT